MGTVWGSGVVNMNPPAMPSAGWVDETPERAKKYQSLVREKEAEFYPYTHSYAGVTPEDAALMVLWIREGGGG